MIDVGEWHGNPSFPAARKETIVRSASRVLPSPPRDRPHSHWLAPPIDQSDARPSSKSSCRRQFIFSMFQHFIPRRFWFRQARPFRAPSNGIYTVPFEIQRQRRMQGFGLARWSSHPRGLAWCALGALTFHSQFTPGAANQMGSRVSRLLFRPSRMRRWFAATAPCHHLLCYRQRSSFDYCL